MRIRKLKLFTNALELTKVFYAETLGFKVIADKANLFTVNIGWSKLTFEHSEKEHKYHYCFLISSNKLTQTIEWLEKKVAIIELDGGRKTQSFEGWNADSIYFYDASGNVAEFIARHDLNNASNSNFNVSDVLCVNEIGLPTKNIDKTNQELQEYLGTEFWKGDLKRFGSNGTQEGLFILPNYEVKTTWFPTLTEIKPEPFEINIEHMGEKYFMKYNNGKIMINRL